jgi:methionyl aminopeptidase
VNPSKNNQPLIELKSVSDLGKMRVAGRAAAEVLKTISESIKAGITTKELDDIAFEVISKKGMKPAFLGYRGYPATACISINDELVHGIPRSSKKLKNGDIVSIDLGTIAEGFYGDCAATFPVGNASPNALRLIRVTRECLGLAIDAVRPGNRLGDVSYAIQKHAEQNGFSVVREYVGHGIGRKLHEEPPVMNFGTPGTGVRLEPGMVICIEPMVNEGSCEVRTLSDGWTVVTSDGKLCAHEEHMVAVTVDGSEILTERGV